MKSGKRVRVISFLFALLMVFTVFAVPTPVEAATKKVTVSEKTVHITPNSYSGYSGGNFISVYCVTSFDEIKNLKSSSKNLVVKQIYRTGSEIKIGFYAKKEGKYAITFDVYSPEGKKRSSHKVNVIADYESAVASVKLGGEDVMAAP